MLLSCPKFFFSFGDQFCEWRIESREEQKTVVEIGESVSFLPPARNSTESRSSSWVLYHRTMPNAQTRKRKGNLNPVCVTLSLFFIFPHISVHLCPQWLKNKYGFIGFG